MSSKAYRRAKFLAGGIACVREKAKEAMSRMSGNIIVRLFGGETFIDLEDIENELAAYIEVDEQHPLNEEEK